MKMNLEEDFVSIGEPFSRHATLDQAEFDDLLALKKDSAPGPDGFHMVPTGVPGVLVRNSSLMLTDLCWKEVLFLIVLLKVEPSLSPRPLTSMTMDGFFDLQTLFAR